jgi:hypothetical protein
MFTQRSRQTIPFLILVTAFAILLSLSLVPTAEVKAAPAEAAVKPGQTMLTWPWSGIWVHRNSKTTFAWLQVTGYPSYFQMRVKGQGKDIIVNVGANCWIAPLWCSVDIGPWSSMLPGGWYEWQIRGVNKNGAGPWSGPRSFRLWG